MLLQPDSNQPQNLKPVSYRSHKWSKTEQNWHIHDQEFFGVVWAIEKFWYYLNTDTTVYTDHISVMQILQKDIPVKPKHLRYYDRILAANINIKFIKGEKNFIADHLSRPFKTDISHQLHSILTPPDWVLELPPLYAQDSFFQKILDTPSKFNNFSVEDDLIYYKDHRLCIPEAALPKFLELHHCSLFGGHIGRKRLKKKVQLYYFFPNYNQVIDDYVKQCHICSKVKPINHLPLGFHGQTTVPQGRNDIIEIDLITGFPSTESEHNAVLTVIDKFTSRVTLVPTTDQLSASGLIQLLIPIFARQGFPSTIQSDRGPQMEATSFKEYFKKFNTEISLGVSHHQQSNGLVEKYNHLVEIYLRCFVQQNPDWLHILPMAEFYLNSQPHSRFEGKSAFEIDLGYQPRSPIADFEDIADISCEEHQSRLHINQRFAHKSWVTAHELATKIFNSNHSPVLPLTPGQKVLIDLRVLPSIPDKNIADLAPKLRPYFCGPFTILRQASDVNYELELPPTMKRDPVFHISQLRPLPSNMPPSALRPPTPAPVIFQRYKDGSVAVELKRILQHRKKNKGFTIEVEFTDGDTQWVPASQLKRTAPEMLAQYASQAKIKIPGLPEPDC